VAHRPQPPKCVNIAIVRIHRPTINLTERLEVIIHDLCARIPEFAHINPRRLLVCVARTRSTRAAGAFAKIIPMRFPDGSPMRTVRDQLFSLPQIPTVDGDVLYLIYVYLPRFFQQPFERRLLTLVHELYHIAPAFDGTIRLFGTRAHGASREQFNDRLLPLIQYYLDTKPAEELLAILRDDLSTLSRQATLVGRTLSVPKAIKLK